MTAQVGVVVVSYGSHSLLEKNLTVTTAGTDVTVVVVDSWSDTSEREAVRALADRHGWAVVCPDTNCGFGHGVNLGCERLVEAGADIAVLLNPDLALSPEGLAALADRAQAESDALVAPAVRRPDGSPYAVGPTDLMLDDGTMRGSARRSPADGRPYEEWLSGACLAMPLRLWRDVGGLAEDYFLYWEDVDLSRRVHDVGGRMVVVPEVVAVHDEGGTQERADPRAKSDLYYYCNIRNRLFYAGLWLDAPLRRAWRRTTPRAAWAVLLQGGRRQLLRSWRPWWAATRGVYDGLRLMRCAVRRRALR